MPGSYPDEFRQRALRMLSEARSDHKTDHAVIEHVAGKLGVNAETLRLWKKRLDVDEGRQPGPRVRRRRRSSGCRRRTPSFVRPTRSSRLRACFSRRSQAGPDRDDPVHQLTHRIVTLIGQSEGEAVVPTWFQGMNLHLGDRSPARVLHEDPFEEAGPRVLAAANAFVGA